MPPVLAFAGFSDSGKTTLLSKVVEILSRRGLRVGVVKHHGHPEPVQPAGKDTQRHLAAGAVQVALTGPGEGVSYFSQPGDPGPAVAAARMRDLDLVLAEGFKGWPGFKIEVLAEGARPALSDDPYLLAVAGSGDSQGLGSLFLDRDSPEEAAGLVIDCFRPPDRLGPLPDREACFSLMARYAMKPNILIHSLVVAEVAVQIAAALVRSGRRLDLPLVEAGALLHDIAKTECLVEKSDHARRGYEILTGLGFPGLARVTADHIDPHKAAEERGLFSPSVVINYADKRVLHDRVVGLEQRLNDLIVRYGQTPERKTRMETIAANTLKVERELFEGLGLEPADLERVNRLFETPGKEANDT